MGQRANLVIVENSNPKIYYSHWHAQETTSILAQGLLFCEKYFKKFNEDNFLMDNAFAEGGILIDKDNQKILIFGGVEISYTPALQRLYCRYITKLWKNWDVIWCSRGIVDFANYLGLMEDRILSDGCYPEFFDSSEWSLTMNKDRDQYNVITIIENAKPIDYKLDLGIDGINICFFKGENLKNIIPEELKIEKWHNEIETTDCLIIDYDTKKIFVCWGDCNDDRHLNEIKKYWPGWEVHRQSEGLIFHFNYTNRNKSVVEMTDKQFEKYCLEYNLFKFEPEI